ncbi:inorganic diphosphatase [Bradyrhizobium sp. CIR3A]|uniref:inorganic diphosphatase n=1 Tax=Bradyrhizobium sp. CIR3A TaxID=2663838 RepID=UPI0028971347|nr:inorganic diphosphatase [Bradyrhizobium sp. CIR3A]
MSQHGKCRYDGTPDEEADDILGHFHVLIIHDSRTYPGIVLCCRPIGILEVEQKSKGKRERNDRIFAVPDRSTLEADLKNIRDLPSHAHDELEQFFRATNALENKDLKFLGWQGPAARAKPSSVLAARECAPRTDRPGDQSPRVP